MAWATLKDWRPLMKQQEEAKTTGRMVYMLCDFHVAADVFELTVGFNQPLNK